MRHLDLFSGIGGFALAARWLGIATCQFVEIDPYCQKVLAKNFPEIPIYGDITTFTAERGRFDLITGGFPCQDNSTANQRGLGLGGSRSGLWFEMLRVIQEAKPRFVVVENVPPSRNRRWDVTARSGMESLGYTVAELRISAAELGAPDLRKRLFLIAYTDSLRISAATNFARIFGPVSQVEKSTWWEKSGELRRGNSGRVFLLPRSWVGRVDDGLPSRLDRHRLHGLGNTVKPQQVAIALQRVLGLDALITDCNEGIN